MNNGEIYNNALFTTHNIANNVFSGMRTFEARFNFSGAMIGKKPAIHYWPNCQTLQAIKNDE